MLIPRRLRERVLDLAHEGHQGLVKTKQRLRTNVWWDGIDKQVESRCKTCYSCQLAGLPTPWINLAADLMGPLPLGEYVLVVVDYYSRYFEVDILTSVTPTKVIECLEKILCTHGLSQSLKTDNGTQLVSDEFERFLKTNDIEHRNSTSLWPQANGEVERQNRSLLKALRIAKAEKKNIWTEMRKFLTAYRTAPYSSTGATPAKLPFNREIRSKIPELGNLRYSDSEARDKDAEMKQERADYADENRRARESELEPVDLVLLKQRKETVSKKQGNEVIISSPEGVNVRRSVTDVKKYLIGDTTGDEQVTEDDASEEDNIGRITESQGRPARERRLPEYLKDYEVYELC